MRAVDRSGLAHAVVAGIAGTTETDAAPAGLVHFGAAVTVLSQAVSNVPAVILFVPALERLPHAVTTHLWLALAVFSTLAGNLTIIGSVANVIVFESARRDGVEVGFLEYLLVGAPLTLITCLIAWAWLVWR